MAAIVDETGNDIPNGSGGMLVIKRPWPSMIRTIWGDPERFKKSYFPDEMGARFTSQVTARCAAPIGAISVSPAVSTTCSMSGSPHGHHGNRIRPGGQDRSGG